MNDLTLYKMIKQGNVLELIIMVVLFFLIIAMFIFIAKSLEKKFKTEVKEGQQAAPPVQRSGNGDSITAVIGASVSEYNKNK
jgi:Na+-transporting methylmalonyl-CoA/oxaloacetate decarboxylase gamma subunit